MGFHDASLLGRFDGFEMSPFFHQFMGKFVFKSYIPDFATGTVRVEDSAHPVFKGLPAALTIENDEWYTYDRSPRPDVKVLANVDENSYVPARNVRMGHHPVTWTNRHYKARNVYFQFGHKPDLLQRRVHDAVPQRSSLGLDAIIGAGGGVVTTERRSDVRSKQHIHRQPSLSG